MDIRKEGPKGPGHSKTTPDRGKDQSNDTSQIRDTPIPPTAPVPVQVETTKEVQAYVDGIRVRYLAVLLRHTAFFIPKERRGTHEYTRAYVEDGKCVCGERNNGRIGPGTIQRVDFSIQNGLLITTSAGNSWAPAIDCQATWEI